MATPNNIAAAHYIRQQAFRIAERIRADENFMADIDTNLVAIETAKHSPLTVLWDARKIFSDEELQAMPVFNSREPKVKHDTNTYYDWYEAADGSEQRFYYDLFEALRPDIVTMRKAVKAYAKKGSSADDKDALAKSIMGNSDDTRENAKAFEAAFRALPHGSSELKRAEYKWNKRFTAGRDMILKAFATYQIVAKLNTSLTSCSIVETEEGYDRSGNAIMFDNKPEIIADSKKTYQRSDWSVGTLMQLARLETNDKGEPIYVKGMPWTKLDQALEEGGGYDRISKILSRGKPEETAETKAERLRNLAAETPEQVNTVVNSLAGFFYDIDDSGNWKLKDKAESKLLEALKAKDQDEAVIALCKLQEALDSIAVKLNPRYSRIQQEAHNAVKPAA